tara:strand:+ start:1797 stop:2363 length:567 start_codon:yes stop_codon:yes gene_type:complete
MIPETISFKNKIIPALFMEEAKMALSFYPELNTVPIEFRLTRKMGTSVMKAQPQFKSLFFKKEKRKYIVLISRQFGIKNIELSTVNIPSEVIIGWIGHELGHIMDYKNRSSLNLIGFGVRYLLSESYLKKAEQRADRFAVEHQMKNYILATKNFILDHTDLTESYKNKIKRLYVSPEDILEFVNEKTI